MVVPAKCTKSSTIQFLFWNGVGALLFSFIAPFIGIDMLCYSALETMDTYIWLYIFIASASTILCNWLLIYANKLTPPTVCSMVSKARLMAFLNVRAAHHDYLRFEGETLCWWSPLMPWFTLWCLLAGQSEVLVSPFQFVHFHLSLNQRVFFFSLSDRNREYHRYHICRQHWNVLSAVLNVGVGWIWKHNDQEERDKGFQGLKKHQKFSFPIYTRLVEFDTEVELELMDAFVAAAFNESKPFRRFWTLVVMFCILSVALESVTCRGGSVKDLFPEREPHIVGSSRNKIVFSTFCWGSSGLIFVIQCHRLSAIIKSGVEVGQADRPYGVRFWVSLRNSYRNGSMRTFWWRSIGSIFNIRDCWLGTIVMCSVQVRSLVQSRGNNGFIGLISVIQDCRAKARSEKGGIARNIGADAGVIRRNNTPKEGRVCGQQSF